uniref:hypothetical protein n=1 Tax=Streptomyces sp. YIM 98790 TaxID=2689077 RepID=UPI0014084D2E
MTSASGGGFGPPIPLARRAGKTGGGRAPAEHAAGFVVSGVLLLVFAGAVTAWLVDGIVTYEVPVGDFLKGIVVPDTTGTSAVLGPYEWALTAALLVTGVLSVAMRSAARGAGLLLAFLLLALTLRQGVGLLDAHYREALTEGHHGAWQLVTYGAGLGISVVVLIVLLRAREAPYRPPGGALRTAGVLLLLCGAVSAAWLVDGERFAQRYLGGGWGDFFHGLVDASAPHHPASSLAPASSDFYAVALAVALPAVGVLALAGRPAARGAGVLLLAVQAYFALRYFTGLEWEHLGQVLDSARGLLLFLTEIVLVPMSVAGVILLLRTPPAAGAGARGPAAAWPAPPPTAPGPYG